MCNKLFFQELAFCTSFVLRFLARWVSWHPVDCHFSKKIVLFFTYCLANCSFEQALLYILDAHFVFTFEAKSMLVFVWSKECANRFWNWADVNAYKFSLIFLYFHSRIFDNSYSFQSICFVCYHAHIILNTECGRL